MAPDVVSKLQTLVTGESKSARKKKAKAEASTVVPNAPEQTSSEIGAGGSEPAGKANGADSENAYVRELQKSVTVHSAPALRRLRNELKC